MMLSSVALVINLNQGPVMLLTGEVFLISLQGVINTSLMEFNLTGDQWLDPSTFRVMLQLNNAGNVGAAEGSPTKALEPLSWNPAVFFRRARIICGGVVVEGIDNFNRLSLMLTETEEEHNPIASEGFCNIDENALKLQPVLVQHIVQKITTNLDLLLFLAEFFSNLCLDLLTKINSCLFVIVRFKSNSDW